MNPAPVPSTPESESAPELANGAKRWRVGTLTYGTAGLIALFCWLLWGDFAWNMKERAIIPMAQLLLKQFQASDLILGLLVTSLPSALGLLLGPIISVRSDRHRGRWGRRIPYLLIPTPLAAAAMVAMGYTPQLADALHAILGENGPDILRCRLIVFGVLWTFFEIFTVIANSVFGGLINDVVPEAVIGRFFGLFRAVGLLAAIIFNFWLIGHAEEYYRLIFITLGLLYGIGFSLMCVMVKEGEYPPPSPAPAGGLAARLLGPIKAYVKECASSPYYIWLFAAIMLGNLAFQPVNAFDVPYMKSIGMETEQFGHLRALSYTISLVLAFNIGWMADKFHPLRLGIATLAFYGLVAIWGGIFAHSTAIFSVAYVAHTVVSGMFFTGTASIGQRLYPRVKFAQFASAAGIMTAFGFMVLTPALGHILDITGHVYRHTFFIGGALALLGCGAFFVVYRQFLRLGGHAGYRAP
jgi:MFS family permease